MSNTSATLDTKNAVIGVYQCGLGDFEIFNSSHILGIQAEEEFDNL